MAVQRHPVKNNHMMFVTTNTKDRRKVFSNPVYAREAIETLYRVKLLHPFTLFGFVIMPDHCHFLLFVPESESISTIMRQYKYGVSFNIGLGPIWQDRFDLVIPKAPRKVLHYIHWNPIKAKLVENPEDYPWSSASGQWKVTKFESI